MSSKIIPLNELVSDTINYFKERYLTEPKSCGVAPGRVNLIGDHVDYCDGFVLPMAINLYTVVVGCQTDDDLCTVETLGDVKGEKKAQFKLGNLSPGEVAWTNYVKGVIAQFPIPVPSFKAVIQSTVPLGAGLSSSASLEVAFFSFLESLTKEHLGISTQEKALLCQKAEHNFTGTPCGVMDQFIAFLGEENNALLIDCRSLTSELVPLEDENISILVANSNVRHELSGSEYSSRRKSCEAVSTMLARSSLRDVSIRELETSMSVLPVSEYRIARHVITEIERVTSAVEALKRNDYTIFGTLMTQSHCSLRDDYKVSCSELDELVEAALECEGVYGSRMTGGGFGGCTVSLLKVDKVDSVIENIQSKCTSLKPTFYVFKPAKGAQSLRI